ncbi:uncharacterized protein LOC62_02G003407 [Vanrija pseudolonga]|uniref:Rhodanese domain-containing protein n=1 Tax=Vanrija pseudolonga TaxID=143232 RepID=A0AAF0Y846_9TREE|nr:hypothetical protein LOC62_02G003407 [Vanrija pseudolonga]
MLRLLTRTTARTMTTKAPWHAALPKPKSAPPQITVTELRELAKTKKAGTEFIVVDARRADFDDPGSNFIHHAAINLPAHTLYQTLPVVGPLLQNIPQVIFHCNSCKAGSRGERTAGWYQDYLDAQGITTSKAYVLEGGFKALKAETPEELKEVAV